MFPTCCFCQRIYVAQGRVNWVLNVLEIWCFTLGSCVYMLKHIKYQRTIRGKTDYVV